MEGKRFLMLAGVLFLALTLMALPFMAACAPEEEAPPPEEGPPEEVAPTPVKFPESISWSNRNDTDSNAIRIIAINALWERELKVPCLLTVVGSTKGAIEKLVAKEIELCTAGYRDQYHAYHGTGDYADVGKCDLRQVISHGPVYMVFYTVPRTGIKTIKDFAGQRVGYTSVRAVIMTEFGSPVLEHEGVLDKIIDLPNLPMAERHSGLAEGTVDVTCGAAQHMNLVWQHSPDAYIVSIPKEAGEYAVSKYPFLKWGTVPEDWKAMTFPPGQGAMVTTVGTICRSDMPEDVIYELLRIMYDHFDELLPVHPTFADAAIDKVVDSKMVMPYHAGAVKFYKDRGVWTAEAEATQKKLLAK